MNAEGRVSGVAIPSFLQMVSQDNRTCLIVVRCGAEHGHMYFSGGELIDAETKTQVGHDAAVEIINWGDGDIELQKFQEPRPRRIERPLFALLLDAHVERDERSRPASTNAELNAEPDPEPTTGSSSTLSLAGVLEAFRREVPEFVSTDIVNLDSGLSIAGGSADPGFDASVASACSAEVVKSNRRTLDLLGLGGDATEDILISTTDLYLLIRMLGREYYQVLAVNRRGNLGLARVLMKKHEPRLLQLIGDLN